MTEVQFPRPKTKNVFDKKLIQSATSGTKNELARWVPQLNDWGKQRTPFLLLTDFELDQVQAFPLAAIDPSQLRYQFHDQSNFTFDIQPELKELNWKPIYVNEHNYKDAFARVQRGLQRGDSFLTNLTFPTTITTNWSLEDIYAHTQARYKLWWKNQFTVFSPEIFVQIKAGKITTFPMKGTLPGYLPGKQLLDDPKESAEHATIVDLMRNDLSRVSSRVAVEQYRYLEQIPRPGGGLWQTSSRIAGVLNSDYHHYLGDILFELLPAGSISGAPKVETVKIIEEAEGQKRGFYTGVAALWNGYELDSCVLIRFVEQTATNMRYWSGGGITAYSNWEEEYQELKEKVYLPLRTAAQVDLSLS